MSIFRLVFFCALFSSHVHNILSALVIWLVHDLRLPWVISTHIFCLTILYNIRGRQISIMVYSHCIGTGPGMGQEPWKASVGFNGLERNDVYAFWANLRASFLFTQQSTSIFLHPVNFHGIFIISQHSTSFWWERVGFSFTLGPAYHEFG